MRSASCTKLSSIRSEVHPNANINRLVEVPSSLSPCRQMTFKEWSSPELDDISHKTLIRAVVSLITVRNHNAVAQWPVYPSSVQRGKVQQHLSKARTDKNRTSVCCQCTREMGSAVDMSAHGKGTGVLMPCIQKMDRDPFQEKKTDIGGAPAPPLPKDLLLTVTCWLGVQALCVRHSWCPAAGHVLVDRTKWVPWKDFGSDHVGVATEPGRPNTAGSEASDG